MPPPPEASEFREDIGEEPPLDPPDTYTSVMEYLPGLPPLQGSVFINTSYPTGAKLANLSSDYNNFDYGDDDDFIDYAAYIVPVVFGIIFIVGIIGNGLLIITVLANHNLRTKPNILIVSLALGDFLLILISVPFTCTIFTFQEWPYGTQWCKINEAMQTLSLGVSVFTLTALSVDRFIAIVYPISSYSSSSRRKTLIATGAIWYLAILLSIMDYVGSEARPVHNLPFDLCYLYPAQWGREYVVFRVIFRLFVYFIVPLIIITILYSVIAFVLLRQSLQGGEMGIRATPGGNSTSSGGGLSTPTVGALIRGRDRLNSTALTRQAESRKRVAKVVLSFVVIFVVCWLPRHIYVICWNFHLFYYNEYWHSFKIIGFCLTFIYSSLNPIILYFLNEEFRRYFRHYLCGLCFKSMRVQSRRRKARALSLSGMGMYGTGVSTPGVTLTPNLSFDNLLSTNGPANRVR